MLGKTGNQRVHRAVCVRSLGGRPEDQLAGDRVHVCYRATGLHGRRVNAGVQDFLRDDDIGACECGVCDGLVASFPLFVNDVVGLAFFIVTNDRCAWIECLLGIGHDGQWIVINVDELECIASDVPRLSNDECDFLALKANLVRGQNCLGVVRQGWHPSQTQTLEILTGDNCHNTGELKRSRGVDRVDLCVCEWAAQDCSMQHARQVDVVYVVAFTTDETNVFLADHAAETDGVSGCAGWDVFNGGHADTSLLAWSRAYSIASRMFL